MKREMALTVLTELETVRTVLDRLTSLSWQLPDPEAIAYRRLVGGLAGRWADLLHDIIAQHPDLDPYKNAEWRRPSLEEMRKGQDPQSGESE